MLSKKERLERIRNILEGKSYLLETNVNVSELEIIESIPVPNKEYAPHINFNYIFFLNKEQVLCTQVFHFQYHEWKWTFGGLCNCLTTYRKEMAIFRRWLAMAQMGEIHWCQKATV